MARPLLVTGEIYHAYNRGTEGRRIFLNNNDYFRFIRYLYEFNDHDNVVDMKRRFLRKSGLKNTSDPRIIKRTREPLVDILEFTLMPNHYHLMLKQIADKGISRFMQRLGTGYTNYFNTKFKRKGVLFQGKYKAKLVDT